MAYTFSALSSPYGVRDVQVDCTNRLKTLELLSSVTVVSKDTTLLTIASEAVNTTVLTKDDGVSTIGVGKGITFTASAIRSANADVKIVVKITGDDTTVDTIDIIQPIVKTITS